jgi:hypothetical protein
MRIKTITLFIQQITVENLLVVKHCNLNISVNACSKPGTKLSISSGLLVVVMMNKNAFLYKEFKVYKYR